MGYRTRYGVKFTARGWYVRTVSFASPKRVQTPPVNLVADAFAGRKTAITARAISADQVMLNSISEQSSIAFNPDSLHQIVLVERDGSGLKV